jgi:ribonuclease P protein component
MREIFRRHQELLPRSCDLLLVARSSVIHWPYAQLERTFSDACGRINSPTPGRSP